MNIEEFKRLISNEILKSTSTNNIMNPKNQINHPNITNWLEELGYNYSKPKIIRLPGAPLESGDNAIKSLSELKKELREAKLLADMYGKIVEKAEYKFKSRGISKSRRKSYHKKITEKLTMFSGDFKNKFAI